MGRKKKDEQLDSFRARFAPKPAVRVRQGRGYQPKPPPAKAKVEPPAEEPREGIRRWEALPDEAPAEVPFDPPARGKVRKKGAAPTARLIPCSVCGRPFDPDAAEHRRHGRKDECGPCGRGEDPPRLQGEMEWYHKNVPVLRIQGRPDPTTPEEKAKLRRR